MIRFGSRTEVYLPLDGHRCGKSWGPRGWRIHRHRAPGRLMNESHPKIYLLPNLMTAGNLFCGFTAVLKILEGALLQSSDADAAGGSFSHGHLVHSRRVFFRFVRRATCAPRRARERVRPRVRFVSRYRFVRRRASADGLSRRAAGIPARMLDHRVCLPACGALRLARFNCVSANQDSNGGESGKEFTGFPDTRGGRVDRVDHAFYALVGAKANITSANGNSFCRH